MLKKIFVTLFIIVLLLVAITAWIFFLPAIKTENRSRFLYVHTGKNNKSAVMQTIEDSAFLKYPAAFSWLADYSKVWEKLRPGKFELKKSMSLFQLARMLRNNQQQPVNLVITKLRTREQLAGLIGRKFETDSSEMIDYLSGDEMKTFGLDSNTAMSAVSPIRIHTTGQLHLEPSLENYITSIGRFGMKTGNQKLIPWALRQHRHIYSHLLLRKKQINPTINP
jgi:UPF0755 protein